jgi:hypothetical protein
VWFLFRYEFVAYFLSQMGMADRAVLAAVHDRFCELDKDGGGTLSVNDLR